VLITQLFSHLSPAVQHSQSIYIFWAGESDEDDDRRMSRGSLLHEAYWRSFFSGGCSGRYVEWEDAGVRDSQEG